VRFGRATRGGLEFDIFTRLLGRLLGLLIHQSIRPSIDDDDDDDDDDDERSMSRRNAVQSSQLEMLLQRPA
jgi:hypothetical protein